MLVEGGERTNGLPQVMFILKLVRFSEDLADLANLANKPLLIMLLL